MQKDIQELWSEGLNKWLGVPKFEDCNEILDLSKDLETGAIFQEYAIKF